MAELTGNIPHQNIPHQVEQSYQADYGNNYHDGGIPTGTVQKTLRQNFL